MRIGFSTLMIQKGRTGIAQHVFALVRKLCLAGREHQFFLFVLKEDAPLFEFVGGAMEIVPVSEEARPPVRNLLWHQRELPRICARLKLDVLHVPSYRRLLWARPCGLVGTIHDLAPFHLPDKYDWKRMFFGRVVVRRLARRQDRIIAISESTARDVQRFYGVPARRVRIIHNGIDHDRFSVDSGAADRPAPELLAGLRSPFFLYVARLEHPAKNHWRLIEAFNRFKSETRAPWQLVLGGSDWHGAPAIHEAIRRSPHARDIVCLGFVGDGDLPALYRAAGVFVYPSLFEGFGLPPLEAMASGTPVISSTRGSLGEVVGDAAVLIDPENVDELKQRMIETALDEGLRSRLRAKGVARARQFDWGRTAEETLKVYSEVHSERSGC